MYHLGASGAIGATAIGEDPHEWDAYLAGSDIGFIDSQLIGAAGHPHVTAGEEAMMRGLRNIDPNAVMIRQEIQRRRRYLDLGSGSVSIPANGNVVVNIQTQRTFRTERMFIPDAVATNFLITQIFVGQNSQFAGGNGVNGSVYSERCFDVKGVLWDTANPGIFIALSVTNLDGAAAHAFSADLRGTSTVR
jgi:hypothetical protein